MWVKLIAQRIPKPGTLGGWQYEVSTTSPTRDWGTYERLGSEMVRLDPHGSPHGVESFAASLVDEWC